MDIYEVLNKIITDAHYYSMSNLFTEEYRLALDEKDMPLFDLLKNISSLGTQVNNYGIKFIPMITYTDGSRSFDVENIDDSDYKLLDNINLKSIPVALRALIADILWTMKKNYPASQIAAQSYWEIFKILYDRKEYYESLDSLRRAVCISSQTKSESLYSKIYDWFCNSFIGEAAHIEVFCSLRTMELFFEQKNTDPSILLSVLDSIISQNSGNDNVLAVEQAYELKTKCYNKMKKNDAATNCNLSLAQFYYDYAERILHRDNMGAFRSVDFFEKSVILFRNNGDAIHAEKAHRKLIEVQKQIPKNMHIFQTTFDVTKAVENIKTNLNALSFEECIIRLTQYVGFESIETLKKRTIEESKNNPLTSLFGSNILDAQGRTIIKLPPLDDKEPEKNQQLLEMHMFQSSLKIYRIVGDLWVNNILRYIRDKFSIDDSMVDFLIYNNCIIPEGRERIFKKGIGMFLRGEYYDALHILAPQMENLFRNIANEVGGLTSTLSDDGLSQEKVLSSVFTLPELLDAYDNNIIFIFRGLLNEQAGANIRNRIAHGIIGESECSSGECLFFGALVIKLLSLTSLACVDIMRNNEKLKDFKKPNEDDIRIIR